MPTASGKLCVSHLLVSVYLQWNEDHCCWKVFWWKQQVVNVNSNLLAFTKDSIHSPRKALKWMQKSIHLQLLFDKVLHLMSLMSLSATFKHPLRRQLGLQQSFLLLDEYLKWEEEGKKAYYFGESLLLLKNNFQLQKFCCSCYAAQLPKSSTLIQKRKGFAATFSGFEFQSLFNCLQKVGAKMSSDEKLVLEADIPLHIRRCDNSSHTMTFVLTQSQCCQKHTDSSTNELSESSSKTSNSSSSNTLQVPSDFSSTERLDMRRRSLNSLLQENRHGSSSSGIYYHTYRRSSAPPNRRASCGWGPVWELRKQFARRNRRLSSVSSDDYQVIIFSWFSYTVYSIFERIDFDRSVLSNYKAMHWWKQQLSMVRRKGCKAQQKYCQKHSLRKKCNFTACFEIYIIQYQFITESSMCHSLSLANGERNNLLSFGARQEMRSAVLLTRNLFLGGIIVLFHQSFVMELYVMSTR